MVTRDQPEQQKRTFTSTLVLLLNIGTPASPSPKDVGYYLREFLSDPRVVDLPWLARKLLVNGLIIPFRRRQSARSYQTIWQPEGSPLLINMRNITTALQAALGKEYRVEMAMRYGKPNIDQALQKLENVKRMLVFPQFPQYASSSTGSAIEKVLEHLGKNWNIPELHVIRDFYDDAGFIDAYAAGIDETLQGKSVDALIMSYHGLPVRHVRKSNCALRCEGVTACPAIEVQNQFCYRAQCYATSRELAKRLQLSETFYHVAFQSRLGRTPWITPYTDHLLPLLRKQGKTNIAVVCPSFIADCLETVEEINIRAREQWQQLGGENFYFIPCLNDHPRWIAAMVAMITEKGLE